MSRFRLAAYLAASLLAFSPLTLQAADPAESSRGTRPVLEVGARGYALTALQGREIERIPLRYLGTYENFIGPGYDVYLVELEGPIADRVGVASGMSGSPVYFDGELIGALAYRLLGGGLPREPVAGVTPIDDIIDSGRSLPALPATGSDIAPIATPISASGIAGPVREWLDGELRPLGFELVAGGGSGAAGGESVTLVPGSPVGAELVRGDLDIAATGTVTWVDGDRVYAFGHPFLGVGRVEMPMVAAEVIHTLGDLAGSVKLSNVGGELGAIVEDRISAIVGRTGQRARMIPVELNVTGSTFGERNFEFELARSAILTPVLAGAVLANALIANAGHEHQATLRASGAIRLAGLPELPLEVAFAGDGSPAPGISLAIALQQTLFRLWNNPFAEVEVEGIRFDVVIEPEVVRYNLDAVLYDREPLQGGDVLSVRCVLSRYRGEGETRELEVTIPAGLPSGSELRLIVGSPAQVDRILGAPVAWRMKSARDLDSFVRALGRLDSPHRLRAVLVQEAPGVISRGAIYDDLPPTAARLLAASGKSGRAHQRRRFSQLATAEVELDGPISGGTTVQLDVRSGSGEEDRP